MICIMAYRTDVERREVVDQFAQLVAQLEAGATIEMEVQRGLDERPPDLSPFTSYAPNDTATIVIRVNGGARVRCRYSGSSDDESIPVTRARFQLCR